ncbi:MAG: prealbumin-like fold domain-containing protein, partial [Propionibacteriaceae bacterium]|nr:prealbumin-like fold domain-containing protein [Propionibacteriaceae bacterium]
GIIAPMIVDLPQADSPLTRDVVVHPKQVTPPLPPPTGGERFLKVSQSGEPLAGAVFNVMARGAGGDLEPVFVGSSRLVLRSGSDGRLQATGLLHGTYVLVEATAPNGYQLLSTPIEFTVTATSLDDELVLQIVNVAKPPVSIPKSGDLSLLLSLTAGAVLIGMGLHLSRRRQPTASK